MVIPRDATGYSWLESDERPGAWMSVASCFAFLRSVTPQAVIRDGALTHVREIDLSGFDQPAEELIGSDDQLDTAVFEAGAGWTVVYQNNCLSRPGVSGGFVWCVNQPRRGWLGNGSAVVRLASG
jgi:hypothetical protein